MTYIKKALATLAATSVLAATALGNTITHKVRKGDTLYNLGQKYNVSWEKIAEDNGIENTKNLRTNQKLDIQTPEFPYQNETPAIDFAVDRVSENLDLEKNDLKKYVMAIRMAENGSQGKEYGIIPTERYRNDKVVDGQTYEDLSKDMDVDEGILKQALWCTWSVGRNLKRYGEKINNEKDDKEFIEFMQKRYCPEDAHKLNKHWSKNVDRFEDRFEK